MNFTRTNRRIKIPSKDEITEFSIMIEDLAAARFISCIDAIVEYCEESKAEIEMCATLISTHLKARITEEAQALNLIKMTSKLPF